MIRKLTEEEIEVERVKFEKFRLSDHPYFSIDRDEHGQYISVCTWAAFRHWIAALEHKLKED